MPRSSSISWIPGLVSSACDGYYYDWRAIESFYAPQTGQNCFLPIVCVFPLHTMAGDEQSQPKNASTSSENAKDRLAQVSSHIEPNTSRRRRKKGADGDLPADYSDILGQIATLRKIAATPDANNRGYVRQKQYVQ
jgi:hypothetical protein